MVDESVEWDIDANLPMYTRDYLKMKKDENKERLKLVLAATPYGARKFCEEINLNFNLPNVIIIRNVQNLEGLRFRYEDVLRAPGWSERPDIEEIEDRILRTHIIMSPR